MKDASEPRHVVMCDELAPVEDVFAVFRYRAIRERAVAVQQASTPPQERSQHARWASN